MDEVDKIIFHSLRLLGCDIDDGMVSLAGLNTDQVVYATVKCLQTITGRELDLPLSLPPSMAARFRLGTTLAALITENGYKGEIGYQTFLYSSEQDIRRVFMFLIERLPKEAVEAAEESLGAGVLLRRKISQELKSRLGESWIPAYCKYEGVRWNPQQGRWHREGCCGVHPFCTCGVDFPSGLGDITKPISKELRQYYTTQLMFVDEQTDNIYQVIPSLLDKNTVAYTSQLVWETEWNAHGLASRLSEQEYRAQKRDKIRAKMSDVIRQSVQKSEEDNEKAELESMLSALAKSPNQKTKGSRFTHAEKLQFAQTEEKAAEQLGLGEGAGQTEKEIQEKHDEEIEELRGELDGVKKNLDSMDNDVKSFTAGQRQMNDELEGLTKGNEESESAYKIKKRTLDLLPDADNNIKQLQGVVDASAQRLVSLGNQWEKHRLPLVDEYRQLKQTNQNKMSESQKKLEEIKELRIKMKESAENVKQKEEVLKQLLVEFEQMTKDVNRSVYTKRIMEIVENVKRQKDQIDHVLIDTRALQKEINQLNGKLDRTFTVTDELIFKDAKKDESVRKAYKYLAALHENCENLMKTVTETGELMREIRELEDKIDNEAKSKMAANLEKITGDYEQLKQENQTLATKLKQ